MPAQTPADPAPATGASRAPDTATQLMSLFEAAHEPPEETKAPAEATPEAPATGESATAETPAEDAAAEEVAAEEPEPTDEVQAEPTLYDVVIDGAAQRVTLDELKAGYSRTGDYTRKTQAVAEDRRRAEAVAREAAQERDRYIEVTKAAEALLNQNAEEPDWTKLADELDPVDFNRERARWDSRQRQLTTLRTQRETAEGKRSREMQDAHAAYLRDEQAKLLTAVPEWKDPTKAQAEQRKLVEFALREGKDYGVTEETISGIDSAFAILVLRDAMRYREMLAAKLKIAPQKVAAPTAKPGANVQKTKVTPEMVARENLKKTGNPKYAEEVFLHAIESGAMKTGA